jgi:hypothetical protein
MVKVSGRLINDMKNAIVKEGKVLYDSAEIAGEG